VFWDPPPAIVERTLRDYQVEHLFYFVTDRFRSVNIVLLLISAVDCVLDVVPIY